MRVAVAICSAGRPAQLARLLPWLARQDRAPAAVLVSVTGPADLPAGAPRFPFEVVTGGKGLPRQRNRALDALGGRCDAVLFLDDDFLPCRDAVAGVARGLAALPRAGGLTGRVLADGIGRGGLAPRAAAAAIAAHEARPPGGPPRVRRAPLYGCNMALRLSAVGAMRFDERLPLYAWQEDVDFGARLPGGTWATDAFAGVHLGTPAGRERGDRLGYAQVANPLYLLAKGTMRPGHALGLMARNLAANHVRAARPEPWIDRAGRARGNRRALADLLCARLAPERMVEAGDV